MAGFTEVLTWTLCSYKENFSMLNREEKQPTAVIISNPRSADFEVDLYFTVHKTAVPNIFSYSIFVLLKCFCSYIYDTQVVTEQML